jgi:hypothetical protein
MYTYSILKIRGGDMNLQEFENEIRLLNEELIETFIKAGHTHYSCHNSFEVQIDSFEKLNKILKGFRLYENKLEYTWLRIILETGVELKITQKISFSEQYIHLFTEIEEIKWVD